MQIIFTRISKKNLRYAVITALLVLHGVLFANGQVNRQWVATYNGIGDFNDHFNCITTDPSGNSYLGGYTVSSDNERDYLVVKLNAAGTLQWSKVFAGSSQARDEANAIKVDALGNVYVTGFINQNITGTDFFTVKLNPNGDTLWTASYNNNSAFGFDQANDLCVDNAGNVFVTGFSDSDPTSVNNEDYLTIKYSPAGVEQWTQRFNGTGNAIDKPVKILTDPSSQYVYITGRSDNGANDDYVTIKYDYAGNQQWRVSGNRGGRDRAVDMVMDGAGSVYVTGRSSNGADDDYWTLKYNTAGTVVWQISYDYVETDRPLAMTIDGSGNVYVTGQSDGDATSLTNFDYLTVKYSSTGSQLWAVRYDAPALQWDIANDISVNATGTVFVTGISDNTVGTAVTNTIVTIAYNASNGNQTWINTYNRGSNIDAEGTVIEANGAGCVAAGFLQTSTANSDALVLNYGTTGSTVWNYSYNGQGNNNENIHSICVDIANNVYACGYIVERDADRNMALIKFNATGNFICEKTVDGTSSGSTDDANGIVLDNLNNPFVAGFTDNSNNSNDIAYFKSNPATCDTSFYRYYNGAASGSDKVYDLVKDAAGNFYVTGRVDMDPTFASNQNCFTAKLGTNGNIIWSTNYNQTAAYEDRGSFIRLGSNGNVFVAGRTFNGTNYDVLLLCYSASGVLTWSQVYDGGANDFASGFVVDSSNNLYVCGRKETAVIGDFDFLTLKYTASGSQQWVRTFTGVGDDEAQAITYNYSSGGPVVTGKTDVDPTLTIDFDMKTIQYDANGNVLWNHTYGGPAAADDIPDDITFSPNNTILMTGHTNKSTILSPNYDIRTVMINATNGAEEWADSYNGPSDSSDIANQILSNGNDFYVAGSTYQSGSQRDALVIKYSLLNTGTEYPAINNATLTVYPNPAGNTLHIKRVSITADRFILNIYDGTGRRVVEKSGIADVEIDQDINYLDEGIYFYSLALADGSFYHGSFSHFSQ